jgi:hypothetical protein
MTSSLAIERRVESEVGQYIRSEETAVSLRRTVPRGVLLRTALLSFCLTACTAARTPTAGELLDKYTKALDSLMCVVIKAETTSEGGYAFDRDWPDPLVRGTRFRGKTFNRSEFRTDGKRLHSRDYDWGNISPARPSVPAHQPSYRCHNWDGREHYQHSRDVNVPTLSGLILLHKPDIGFGFSRNGPLSYLMGYNLESDERLDTILRRAESIAVRPKTERIGGSDCRVIEARTDSGRIALWIDPGHGYHAARAEAELVPGELAYGRPMRRGWARETRLENVRFEKVGGLWAPMEADVTQSRLYGGNNRSLQKYHYKRTMVLVNPDHDALGSFENPLRNPANDPELRNGTDVMLDNKTYHWRDDNVVDDAGSAIIEGRRKKSSGREEQSQSTSAESSRKSPTQPKQPNLWQLIRKNLARQTSSSASDEGPTAGELLDRWTRTLDACSFGSYIVEGEGVSEHNWRFTKNWHEPSFRGIGDKGKSYTRMEFRTDGKRSHWRQYHWGHISPTFPNVTKDEPCYNCLHYVNGWLYQHNARVVPGRPAGIVKVHESPDFRGGSMDAKLQGYLLGGDKRTDRILREGANISVRPKTERIGESDCYVIDVKRDDGRVTLWIDPQHGYHPARLESRSTGRVQGAPGVRELVESSFENFRFEKRNAVWQPMEVDFKSLIRYGDGSYTGQKSHYKRTQILLKPDHEALGSFDNPLENPKNDPVLSNETKVRLYKDGGREEYVWRDGKMFDGEGKAVVWVWPTKSVGRGRPKKDTAAQKDL